MKTLIFEGAGWDQADTSIQSGVGNCRIRTRLRNDSGRLIYLEMGGRIVTDKNAPQLSKSFNVVGHVWHCFYDDSEWDSRRNSSAGLNFVSHQFEYSKEGILQFVNDRLNCSFDSLEVINDGSVRVHDTRDPLCESITEDYEPYRDLDVHISELRDVAPLYIWPHGNMAKYQLNYDFVRSIPFIRRYMEDRTEREKTQFQHGTYYINLRWNKNGTITSAEITGSKLANFGIGLDTLRHTLDTLVKQKAV